MDPQGLSLVGSHVSQEHDSRLHPSTAAGNRRNTMGSSFIIFPPAKTQARRGEVRAQTLPVSASERAKRCAVISVIVCTRNRSRSLQKVLDSFSRIIPPLGETWELVLVDNNSTDDSAQTIRRFAALAPMPVRCVFEPRTGLSHARNAGIGKAQGQLFAFTDDDVALDSAWLCELQKAFARFDCLGVGGRIIPVWDHPKPPWLVTDGPGALMDVVPAFELGPEPCQMKTAPYGANMAYRREAFEKYGLFRTDLGRVGTVPLAGEDTEFGHRLLSHGERVDYSPRAIVYHPVEKERTKKKYLERRYFHYGRTLAHIHGFPEDAVRYFGVPRYLARLAASSFGQWLVTLDSRRRFHHKLSLLIHLGEITEARHLSAEKTAHSTAPS